MLPNKQKTPKSAEAEMSVFRIWRAISIANAKSHPFRFHRVNGFLLVEALPQAPINAVFQTAAARFCESLL